MLISNIKFFIGINVIKNYLIGWVVSFGLVLASRCSLVLFASCVVCKRFLLESKADYIYFIFHIDNK